MYHTSMQNSNDLQHRICQTINHNHIINIVEHFVEDGIQVRHLPHHWGHRHQSYLSITQKYIYLYIRKHQDFH